MIKIVAKNKIKEGKREEFINAAKELIKKSQAEEGCISYELYEDIGDSHTLTFIESWKDKESIDKHNSSAHFTAIVPILGQFIEEKDVRLYSLAK
ncbi:MAG: antibiotic biosynthesis monooxygenase [Maledivibacter sp.]|jgi:quinol monooxygenase YgiN|nr:antibiotic biosynthesis monooxygenase [Maledivibacter sp.]